MRSKVITGLFVCVWMALLTSILSAQTSTARISGGISDESGAVLPGVQINVKNVATGVTRSFTTDERGRYVAPELIPGPYEVTASMSGFETVIRSGITLTVGQDANISISLKVGAVSEQVTVTGDAPLVDTSSSSVSGVVEEKRIQDLPLNGRDFSQLALVEPAVISVRNTDAGASKGFGTRVSMAGSRSDQTTWLLDGTDMRSVGNFGTPGSASGVMMGVDAVREFRVLTGAYSSEFGGNSGGVIQMVTKSGTNNMHGSVYEFLRNDNVDSAYWENNRAGQKKAEFRRNQFGGALGGALKKDKFFYFGNFEALRQASAGGTLENQVPDLNARTGLIGGRQLVVGPSIKPYLDIWPAPNGRNLGDGTAIYSSPVTRITNETFFVARADYYISPNQSLFVREQFDNGDDSSPANLNLYNTKIVSRTRFTTLQYERIISSRWLSTSRVSYNRTNISPTVALNLDYPKGLYYLGSPFPPTLSASGITDFGVSATDTSPRIQNLYEFAENLVYNSGAHSMKFGTNIKKSGFNTGGPAAGAFGTFTYTSVSDLIQDNTLFQFQKEVPGGNTNRSLRQMVYGFYFQDDWQMHPNFTVNAGIRYEPYSAPTEKWGRIATIVDWIHDTKFTTGGSLFESPGKKNFSPRVGFAWNVGGGGKTAIRAGAGLFNEVLLSNYFHTVTRKNPPFTATISDSRPTYNMAGSSAYALRVGPTLLSPNFSPSGFSEFIQYHLDNSLELKWNFSIERQLLPDLSLSLGYIGSQGTHLFRLADGNAAPPILVNGRPFIPTGTGRLNPANGVSTVRYSDAKAFYNGMIVEVKKRFSHSFQAQTSYTWSKNVDDTTTGLALTDYNEGATSQPYNPKADRGLSSLHLSHNFVLNGLWTLPSPIHSAIAGTLVNGWRISGIFSASSGAPAPIQISGRTAQDLSRAAGRQRPELVTGRNGSNITSGTTAGCAGVAAGQKLGTPDLYYDPCAFVLPPAGFYGNAGRNILLGPGFVNLDFSLLKSVNVHINEGSKLEFHADAFNIFNHPNFGAPNVNVRNAGSAATSAANGGAGAIVAGAGRIDKTVGGKARQLQFGLKLIF